ncbi:MAG: SDR family NAD(P)-dependent oxidoreductase [Myxococcota bacterium]
MGLMDGAKALVTGGASGIGLAVGHRLAQEGAAVALLDVAGEKLEGAAARLGCPALVADVSDAPAMEDAVERAARELDGLSVLVNNAGRGHLAPLHENRAEDVEAIVGANLTGVFNTLRPALPRMLASGGGSVVNVASGSAVRPTFGEAPYSAAKAGLVALTSSIAQEYGPSIRANCVSPGVIRTPMTELLFQLPGALEPIVEATPLARTGAPEEVADTILFLCSDMARFVTGQNLVVDGGLGLAQAGIDRTLRDAVALMGQAKRGRRADEPDP